MYLTVVMWASSLFFMSLISRRMPARVGNRSLGRSEIRNRVPHVYTFHNVRGLSSFLSFTFSLRSGATFEKATREIARLARSRRAVASLRACLEERARERSRRFFLRLVSSLTRIADEEAWSCEFTLVNLLGRCVWQISNYHEQRCAMTTSASANTWIYTRQAVTFLIHSVKWNREESIFSSRPRAIPRWIARGESWNIEFTRYQDFTDFR